MFVCRISVTVLLSTGLLAISGCGHSGSSSSAPPQSEAAVVNTADVVVTSEMGEVLAKADALDGQVDKVVSLCASCDLGMAGSEKHSLHVGPYTMYFCADHCRQAFSEDISRSVLAMKLPPANDGDSP